MLITMTRADLQELGFGPGQASDIIRRAKRVMVNRGFGYYENKRLGRVPIEAIEEVLGIQLYKEGGSLRA